MPYIKQSLYTIEMLYNVAVDSYKRNNETQVIGN